MGRHKKYKSFIVLEKHPEIKELMGHDTKFKHIVLGMVAFQLASLFIVCRLQWPALIILAYCVGGVINHSLMLGKTKRHVHIIVSVKVVWKSDPCIQI